MGPAVGPGAPQPEAEEDCITVSSLAIASLILGCSIVGALSVGGAIFLILELSDPYGGPMRISDTPMRRAMAQIDQ